MKMGLSLKPAARENTQPVAVPEKQNPGEDAGLLPFEASKEMLVTIAARILAGSGAVEFPAPGAKASKTTEDAECDPHAECNSPWQPSVSDVHRQAARGAMNLLLACEEVAGEYRDFLCQREEAEKHRQRIAASLPEHCSFEEGLRRIFPTGKGPKKRESEYGHFLDSELEKRRFREPGVTIEKILQREQKAGFSRSLLQRRMDAFQEWHISDVAGKRSEFGARGGRNKRA